MSCEACATAQDERRLTYFRWKNANVEMVGCEQHLKQIFEVLRAAQAPKVTLDEIKKTYNEALDEVNDCED